MLSDMDRGWDGEEHALDLPTWSGAQHLAALRRHIVPGPGVPRLDLEGYAAELLLHTDEPEEDWAELTSHALCGVLDPERGPAGDDGRFVELSCGTRIRMGDCPWSERVQAARAALGIDDGAPADPVRVVEQVLAQVLDHVVVGTTTIDQLAPASLVQLAGAVLDRYDRALTDGDLEDLDLGEPDVQAESARLVLALHRSLGRLRPPPHSPPRRQRPEPRWPTTSRPPSAPLLVAPR